MAAYRLRSIEKERDAIFGLHAHGPPRRKKVQLPFPLVLEILSRLPVKSVFRFRCVCRDWCTLPRNDHFVKQHRALGGYPGLLLFDDFPEGPSFCYLEDGEPHPHDCDGLPCTGYNYVEKQVSNKKSSYVSNSCNGLICVCGGDSSVYLVNPSTREPRVLLIKGANPYEYKRHYTPVVGLGYHAAAGEYKVLRLFHTNIYPKSSAEVLTLGTDQQWRRLGDVPCFLTVYAQQPVQLFGALHWPIYYRTHKGTEAVIAFDIAKETFSTIPHPEADAIQGQRCGLRDPWMIADLGGYLSFALERRFKPVMDIWVLGDSDYHLHPGTWMKVLSIPLQSPYNVVEPTCLWNGKILFSKYGQHYCYDPIAKKAYKLQLRQRGIILPYTESLISAKDLTKGLF